MSLIDLSRGKTATARMLCVVFHLANSLLFDIHIFPWFMVCLGISSGVKDGKRNFARIAIAAMRMSSNIRDTRYKMTRWRSSTRSFWIFS